MNLPPAPGRGVLWLTAKTYNAIRELLARPELTPDPSQFATITRANQKTFRLTHLPEAVTGPGGSQHPWKATESGTDLITIAPGKIMGFLPRGDAEEGMALPMVTVAFGYSGGDLTITESGYIYAKVTLERGLEGEAGPIPETGSDTIESYLFRPSSAPTVYFSASAPDVISLDVGLDAHFLIAKIEYDDGKASVSDQYLTHNPIVQLDEILVMWGS